LAVGLCADVVSDRPVVVHGLGVGHAADRREAAGRGRSRARRDRFLVLVTRLAQVHVHVDESRTHPLAGCVDFRRALRRREPAADARDLAVLDQHVLDGIDRPCGIDHPAPTDDEGAHGGAAGLRPPASKSNTAMRTATPLATWSRITEYGPSATSGDSSTPRFTGPGCMISTSGLAWAARRSSVKPQ